jgi:quinol monooxygenase YgiN
MSRCITWIVVVEVPVENRAAWEALAEEMSAATAEESGTLIYEWHWNAGGDTCSLIERYVDSDAAMIHVGNFGAKFAERFTTLGTPVHLDAYGPVSDALRAALDGFGASYHATFAGFGR